MRMFITYVYQSRYVKKENPSYTNRCLCEIKNQGAKCINGQRKGTRYRTATSPLIQERAMRQNDPLRRPTRKPRTVSEGGLK